MRNELRRKRRDTKKVARVEGRKRETGKRGV